MTADATQDENAACRDVRHVTVVGAGVMGAGIAQVAAQAGYDVSLVDTTTGALDAARRRITNSLAALVQSSRLTERDANAADHRIIATSDTEAAACRADLVIEAIIEELPAKQNLFRLLGDWCDADVVLATNTSQFRIALVAERTAAPGRVIGMHWSNPPQLMPLVEVIRSPSTSDGALDTVHRFLTICDRQMIVCRKDIPGFISNRLILVLFMEAARLVDEEVADPSEIDTVARLMFGHKMGPLETLDLAGLDTVLRGCTAMAEHYGERYLPPPILHSLVDRGRLGRKSGAGFYPHT